MIKPGRPKAKNPLDEYIEVRVSGAEKQGFRDAAERSGLPLATWMRQRLRRIAIRELENADLPVAFLKCGDMIKPKYRKGMDFSQIARPVIERATRTELTPHKTHKKKVVVNRRKLNNS
jgi:hypothetical protein